ncbi:MAG: HDOD domain-containing protein [Clostridiales Family XIII bacterium]|nr:HDOD domain-containing protein [Clostridiales Family XIII bacterium]
METFIARQPIFDKRNEVYAYELLYRSDKDKNYFDPSIDPDLASTRTIINSFIEIGLDRLTNGRKAFVNCTERLLVNGIPTMLPSKYLVVEVLEDVKAKPDTVAACLTLKEAGYMIALDDFELNEDNEEFVAFADIIKIDFLALPVEKIEELIRYIKRRKDIRRKPRLLAEKIESHEMHELALKLGFTYFQGYYFSKPVIVTGHTLSPISINRLRVMSVAMKDEIDFHELAEVIRKDVAMSYRLLKLVNSAYFAFSQKVGSIHQALVILGTLALRKWIALICLAEANPEKSMELVRMSMIRARFMEYAGAFVGKEDRTEILYMIGMFSMLDALMDAPIETVLEQMGLDPQISAPLLEKKGSDYELLRLIEKYEKGDFDAAFEISRRIGLKNETVAAAYVEAVSWAGMLGI